MLLAGAQIGGRRRLALLEALSLSSCLLLLVKLGRNAIVVAHLLRDLHHVEVLETLTALDAEREVALLARDRVAVESKLA